MPSPSRLSSQPGSTYPRRTGVVDQATPEEPRGAQLDGTAIGVRGAVADDGHDRVATPSEQALDLLRSDLARAAEHAGRRSCGFAFPTASLRPVKPGLATG